MASTEIYCWTILVGFPLLMFLIVWFCEEPVVKKPMSFDRRLARIDRITYLMGRDEARVKYLKEEIQLVEALFEGLWAKHPWPAPVGEAYNLHEEINRLGYNLQTKTGAHRSMRLRQVDYAIQGWVLTFDRREEFWKEQYLGKGHYEPYRQ